MEKCHLWTTIIPGIGGVGVVLDVPAIIAGAPIFTVMLHTSRVVRSVLEGAAGAVFFGGNFFAIVKMY